VTVAEGKRISERVAAIREEVMARKGSFPEGMNCFVRDVALWRAAREGRSQVQVRAALLHELVKLAKIEIRPRWKIVGQHLIHGPGPSWGFAGEVDANAPDAIGELGVGREDIKGVRSAVKAWCGAGGATSCVYGVGETTSDYDRGLGGWGGAETCTVCWGRGWIENHSVRDYAKVLRLGFRGIRDQVEQCLQEPEVSDPDLPRKENFWKAALSVCDAGILIGERYAELAGEMAADASCPEDRERLQGIAEKCARVPAEGARTFAEAVQALWLAHVLTCGEDGINANSIGRLDQILSPYYQRDLEAGRLTREEATEIMEELACKLYLEYDVQAITLGGQDRAGRDSVNELSYIILEATRNVDFVRDLSIRLHRNGPPDFVRLASELIVRGGGIPFIFNDECFVKALNDRGIALEDARDYTPIGCIELTIPGRANPHAVSGWFSSTKCLELALFDGIDPASGQQVGPQTGKLSDMAACEDLFESYCRQVEFFAERMVYHCNRGELSQRERGPLPCWSVLTDDCIARGRDITDGGAVYNYHSICFLGTANTADSLMAMRKLVFEEGTIQPGQLLEALRENFQGSEALRQMLVRQAPKYGNDCAEVDEIARRIDEHFIHVMDRMRSPLDGRYFVHLFSFLCNISFGKMVGATPDGRRAGEPLAYSLSAHQGRDEKGVTAMLNSLAKLPHDQAAGATAAIIEVDPVLVQGDGGVDRMCQLIESAIAMGVGQLQWNVTTVERLKQAQEDPENYGNIAVRVAGYSQMFKLINGELQDHIIARTKHRG